MSNSQYFPGGRNTGEAPEKSNFAQILDLLSQNIKEEKGSPRDINLGINGKLEPTERSPTTTMNLLTNMKKSGQLASTNSMNDSSSKPETREPKTDQMTIFYAGKMFVFDDFPAEKVSEVLLLASKGSSPYTAALDSTSADPKIEHGAMNSIASASSNPTQRRLQMQFNGQKANASLHRFFEKRKNRAIARAPYQVHNPSPSSPKNEEQFDLNL